MEEQIFLLDWLPQMIQNYTIFVAALCDRHQNSFKVVI
jgi:hypothetical protein